MIIIILLHLQHWVFVSDRTLTIDVVFQSCGFYGVPRILIADTTGRHLGLTDTLGLDLRLVSIRYQTK